MIEDTGRQAGRQENRHTCVGCTCEERTPGLALPEWVVMMLLMHQGSIAYATANAPKKLCRCFECQSNGSSKHPAG